MTIYAAGAVCWREDSGKLLVALVNRARYDDWSWPKGKVDPGETLLETAVREIAEETVRPAFLKESVIGSLQRVLPDDDDEVDDIGSLSQSAEALRITAAAPVRNTSLGGDYEG